MLGSISTSVLWGCLEISTQVVSACIPSLMPLFLSFLSKGRRSKQNELDDLHDKKNPEVKERNDKQRSSRSNRLTDLLSLGDAEPLPEAIDASMISRTARNETDHLGLVEAGKRSQSGIVVTDRIDQVNEPRGAKPEGATTKK